MLWGQDQTIYWALLSQRDVRLYDKVAEQLAKEILPRRKNMVAP